MCTVLAGWAGTHRVVLAVAGNINIGALVSFSTKAIQNRLRVFSQDFFQKEQASEAKKRLVLHSENATLSRFLCYMLHLETKHECIGIPIDI